MSTESDAAARKVAQDAAKNFTAPAGSDARVEVELTLEHQSAAPNVVQVDPAFLSPQKPEASTPEVKIEPVTNDSDGAIKVDPVFLSPSPAPAVKVVPAPENRPDAPKAPAPPAAEFTRPPSDTLPSKEDLARPNERAQETDHFKEPKREPEASGRKDNPFSAADRPQASPKDPLTRNPQSHAPSSTEPRRDWGAPSTRPASPLAGAQGRPGAAKTPSPAANAAKAPSAPASSSAGSSGAVGAAAAAKDLLAKDANAGAGGKAAKAAGAVKGIQGALEGFNEGGVKGAALKGAAGAKQGAAAVNSRAAQAQSSDKNGPAKGDGKLDGKTGVKIAGSAIKAALIGFLTSVTGVPPEVWGRIINKKTLVIAGTALMLPPLLLLGMILNSNNTYTPAPEADSDDQAAEYIPVGWMEALQDAAGSTRRAAVPVPWTVLGGIAKATTDFGRTSPYDATPVDHDKPRQAENVKESVNPETGVAAVPAAGTSNAGAVPGANALAPGVYASSSCSARLPDPGIGGDVTQAKGPFLLTYPAWREMEDDGMDPNDPCEAAEWVAEKLAATAEEYLDANPDIESPWEDDNANSDDPAAERDADAKFWAQIISQSRIIQDPTGGAAGGECTVPPSPNGESYPVPYLIEQIWSCEIGSGDTPQLVTAIKDADTNPVYLKGENQASIALIQEAYAVSYAFSQWQTESCDPKAKTAGVFPLDQGTATTYGATDRCNPQQNIRAAARAVLAVERQNPESRPKDLGPYQPMLGGWLNLSNVFGNDKAQMLKSGPTGNWEPSQSCKATVLDLMEEAGVKGSEFAQLSGQSGVDIPAWEGKFRSLGTKVNFDHVSAACQGGSEADVWRTLADAAEVKIVAWEEMGDGASVVPAADGSLGVTPSEREAYVGLDAFFLAKATSLTDSIPTASYGNQAVVGGRLANDNAKVSFPSVAATNISQPLTSIAERATDYAIFYGGTSSPFDSVGVRVRSLVLAATSTTGLDASQIPADLVPLFMQFGQRCPLVTPAVLAAQAKAESGFNPRAVSPVGAKGLSQFMPATWAAVAIDGNGDGVADPFNPADAIASQAKYMCDLSAQYADGKFPGSQLDLTLAAYNAGSGNVRKYGGIPPFKETTNYIAKINQLIVLFSTPPSAAPVGVPANVSGGGPGAWGNQSNGRIAASELRALSWAPNYRLRCDATMSMEALNAKYRSEHGGKNIPVNSAYRDYATQAGMAARQNNAAAAGKSNHGWGLAVDIGAMQNSHSSEMYVWWTANAGAYGWKNPEWAKRPGRLFEPWHWEFQGSYDPAANAACMSS